MKKSLIPIICFIFALIGCIKINIINTNDLSPLGNKGNDFQELQEDFGEDYSKFMEDKAIIKIYVNEEDDSAKVSLGDNDIRLTSDNPFLEVVEPVFSYIDKGIENIKDKFDENTENKDIQDSDAENKENVDESEVNSTAVEEDKEEIDFIVDDFIKNME